MAEPKSHATFCKQKTHKNGKWCWLPEEIASLKEQYKEGRKSWKEISESFASEGVNRHGVHQCHKKAWQVTYLGYDK